MNKKVLIAGAECAPFAKTGGLADVIGTLPRELINLGVDARVIMPYHRIIKEKYFAETTHITHFTMELGWRKKYVGIETLLLNGVTYYFIDSDDYFYEGIYKGGEAEGEQYAFFSKAVLECLPYIEFMPDIIHCNDWHTAMIPTLIKTNYQNRSQGKIKTLYTIHNMMYQGKFSYSFVNDLLNIDAKYYKDEGFEAYGCANFTKGALYFADKINTVSPSYAMEIKTPYYAYGMEGILNKRSDDLSGIVNGIDVVEYNPKTDPFIPFKFTQRSLGNKTKCKKELAKELGLKLKPTTKMVGMVTRLTAQKGLDLIMGVFHEMMEEDIVFVLLGNGDKMYENFFRDMEHCYPGRVCSYIGYDDKIAHKIYGASDLFLMPSKFEPCGISQMISQRYGTLPIVRETGGLRDTVVPYNEITGEGNGFSFANFNAHEMLNALRYAVKSISDKQIHKSLMQNAMELNNSFAASAQKYFDLFENLV